MLDGIYVENIGNAVIKSNRITNVNGRGIQVIASQTGKLYGNAVTGSRKCGLYVSRSKISGNKRIVWRIMAVLMQFMRKTALESFP